MIITLTKQEKNLGMTWNNINTIQPTYDPYTMKSEQLEIMLSDNTVIKGYYSPWCGWCRISSFYYEYMIPSENILKWKYLN